MNVALDLLADLLEAYEAFDHYDPPDLPEEAGVLNGGATPVPSDQLRPADRIVRKRVEDTDSGENLRSLRERELRTVYHHVGLLITAECLIEQEDFYEELPVPGLPRDHDVRVLTMRGHQLLDRLKDESGGDSKIGFVTS